MSLKVDKTENKNELKLTFTVEAEKFDNAIKVVYEKNKKYFNIPGFRKGHAPLNIVEKTYGAAIFYEEAFNLCAGEEFEKEIKENTLELVGKPEIDITQMEKGKELIFEAIVATKPEVEVKNYKGLEIKKIEYKVTNKDIEEELNKMAEKNAKEVSVEDRAVEKDDIANINFEGFIDGVAFEGGKAENYDLVIGSNSFIPGFEDQIIGMKIGEEKDINVEFPKEYHAEAMAGKPAVFKVKVNEIRVKELPALDDEFAKDTTEFDTLEEVKKSIKEKLEHENEHKAKHETEDAVIEKLMETVEVEIPKAMIEEEIDNMIKDIEARLQYQGLNIDQYLQIIGKTMEEVRKEYEEQAKKDIKMRLTIEAVIKAENIVAEEDKIEERIKEFAKAYGRSEEELLNNEAIRNNVKNSLQFEKAIALLVENAKIK